VRLSVDERALAREALRRILGGAEATLQALASILPRAVDNESRRRLKDVVVGVSVLRLRLAYLVLKARHPRASFDEPRLFAALVDAEPDAWIDAFLADDEARDDVCWPADPTLALMARRSCPLALASMLLESLGGDDADAFLAASNRAGPITLRTNIARTTRAALAASLADDGLVTGIDEQTPWALHLAPATTRSSTTSVTSTSAPERSITHLSGSRAWRAGWFEVQDASSQRVALASSAHPDDVVVDLCAGRGGKTLALAAMMQDRGRLIAHDPDERALCDLRGRVRRLGLRCVELGAQPTDGAADIVVVDAPCTSTGVLRRAPDRRFLFTASDVQRQQHVQREVLARAARLVAPGGRVVYATCSVLEAENDDVIADGPPELERESQRLLLPHRDGGDGFFIACFRRRRPPSASPR
jgi:16S rRNA (cytosine967-C5)-methyltransferase